MKARDYRIGLGDGCYGPGDVAQLIVSDGGTVRGPQLPDWQPEYILGICQEPKSYHGEPLQYVVLSPRYTTDTLKTIRESGGVAAVGRVRPPCDPLRLGSFMKDDVEYWAVGVLSHIES